MVLLGAFLAPFGAGLVALLALPGCGGNSPGRVSETFASGPDWTSYDGDLSGKSGDTLGPAKLVCVNATRPATCPSGAVIYGHQATGGWAGTIALAPTARWIWRGDVDPTHLSDLQFAVFEKTFTLGDNPSGQIEIAVDDLAEVHVNGTLVGTIGSVSEVSVAFAGQQEATTFELSSFLRTGENTVTVIAQNGPPSFAGCPVSCAFASNTAGVVFGGVLEGTE